tara:strand:+ start:32 stop:457 length:426 start_codon:yes stop_codon:yes gene_type:complete
LLLFSCALEFEIKKNKMNNLIIDAANEKILFKIIDGSKSYTSSYPNSRENFDKILILLFEFLKENDIKITNINNIFVNQGPGSFSGIRCSIAVAKGLCFANKLDLYGFNNDQVKNKNYTQILDLFKKGLLIKNLIKPLYLS